MCPNLFVYGTLRSSFDNPFARTLAAQAKLLGPAWLCGRLYQVTPRYPGLVLSESPGDVVRGEIFQMRDPEVLMARLDEYEACAAHSPEPLQYERVLTNAHLQEPPPIEVWTYVYRLPVREEDFIASGSYGPRASV